MNAAGSGAALAEVPAAKGIEGLQENVARPDGHRPGGGNGGSEGGRLGPQRRPLRVRATGPSPAPAPPVEQDGEPSPGRRPSCTLAQMRRFIKSRPYVPVHELRRRFEIEGIEDEVSPVATERGTIYVGLPPEQAQFLGDLIRAGDVGCEMLLDPDSPAVVGVFPMRPVARQ
jgi:hypothetical protein